MADTWPNMLGARAGHKVQSTTSMVSLSVGSSGKEGGGMVNQPIKHVERKGVELLLACIEAEKRSAPECGLCSDNICLTAGQSLVLNVFLMDLLIHEGMACFAASLKPILDVSDVQRPLSSSSLGCGGLVEKLSVGPAGWHGARISVPKLAGWTGRC